MKTSSRRSRKPGAGEEAGTPADEPAPGHGGRRVGGSARRYSVAEKLRLVEEFVRGDETFEEFCARKHVSTASLCTWRRELAARGEAGLSPKSNPRNRAGRHGAPRTPEARRQAVEAFAQSGMGQVEFARVWGLSVHTLRNWIRRYQESGPKGLEPKRRGRPPGSGGTLRSVPESVRAEIARTKLRFPVFGLKRVRDFLSRFSGVRVSTGTVARVLDERQVPRAIPPRKKKRARSLPRRFERALANDLWQTDITSFTIGRSHVRVYLIVFLDDFSRFIVSHGLYVYQRGEIAKEVLLDGIARFGKPREVLSDQGRQYFAWRGKSDFQHLLKKQGIHHAVARAHHPETVGKCERFWETLKSEFLARVELDDLPDARARIAHFVAHYNFFRPHQGIGGLVPADRYFGAEAALRKTHEARLAQDELSLALAEQPRTSAYLFGQIGDEQVSVHGARGQLVVQTSSGLRQEIGLKDLGAPSAAQGANGHAGNGRADGGGVERRGERDDAAAAVGQEAAGLRRAGEDASGGEGAVAGVVERSAGEGAPCVRGDSGDVAGQEAARGGGAELGGAAAAGVAAQPAGAQRYAGGAPEAAQDALAQRGDDGAAWGGQPARPEVEGRGPGRGQQEAGGTRGATEGAAAARECAAATDEVGSGGENTSARKDDDTGSGW
jgi:transposase InsO family protein